MLGRTLATIAAAVFIIPTGVTGCRKEEPRPAPETSASRESPPGAAEAAAAAPVPPASPDNETISPGDVRSTEPELTSDVKPDDTAAAAQTGGPSADRPGGTETAGASDDHPGGSETGDSVLGDEIEREMLSRWARIQSASAKMMTTVERTEKPQTHQRGIGTYDCLKRDGRLLIRSSHYNAISAENDNEEIPWIITGERFTKVSDGQFLYTLLETHEGMTATKRYARFPRVMPMGGVSLFFLLRSLDHLERLPDTTIDDVPVLVLQGTARGGEPRNVRVFLDPEAGIMRQMVIERPVQHSTFTFTFSEVKFDVEFPEDHFTFTPPEGVTIEDRTQPRPAESSTPDDTIGPREPLGPEEAP